MPEKSSRIMRKTVSHDDYLLFSVLFTSFFDLYLKMIITEKAEKALS